MTTAIDTNILVALWDVEDALHRSARQLLEATSEAEALVISGLVYAELLAAPGRSEEFLDRFLVSFRSMKVPSDIDPSSYIANQYHCNIQPHQDVAMKDFFDEFPTIFHKM